MKRIWKFELGRELTTVKVPADAKPLCVREQHGVPCLWILLDDSARRVERCFLIVGTGQPIEQEVDLTYVGTVLLADGHLVYHVFEVPQSATTSIAQEWAEQPPATTTEKP